MQSVEPAGHTQATGLAIRRYSIRQENGWLEIYSRNQSDLQRARCCARQRAHPATRDRGPNDLRRAALRDQPLAIPRKITSYIFATPGPAEASE